MSRRGNTHIPRTPVSPEKKNHFPRSSLSHYVWRPQGIGSLPNSRPGFGKLPTRQFWSSMRSSSPLLLNTQLGRVSPYGYEVSPPHYGLAGCGLPKQAHLIYIGFRSPSLPSVRLIDLFSFRITLYNLSEQ